MPKIAPDGTVSYEPGREPDGPRGHPGTGVPMEGAGHPADGTMSPPVSDDGGEVQAAVIVSAPEAAGTEPGTAAGAPEAADVPAPVTAPAPLDASG